MTNKVEAAASADSGGIPGEEDREKFDYDAMDCSGGESKGEEANLQTRKQSSRGMRHPLR